jgi:hypothetical protein
MVQRAKLASVVGIVVGTLSVAGYADVLTALRRIVRDVGLQVRAVVDLCQRMCMRSKAWLAASVSLRLARLPPLQAGCGGARPSRACFGHKTVKADHI